MRLISQPLSRRQMLQSSLSTAVAAALPRALWAANAPTLATKAIGATSERLPVIGLGTDSFRKADYPALREEIEVMEELGGTVIDTAAAYGDSEALIGRAMDELRIRNKVFLATKLVASGGGFMGNGVVGEKSLARSLKRLQTPYIDLLQIHNLNGVDTLITMLQDWKKVGKIRYIGITTSRVGQHEQMADFMRKMPLDFVQFDYSIGERDAETTLLPLAQEHHIAVIANLPFGHASLIQQAGSHPLPPWAAELGITSWPQYFLKYVASHPAVTCVIPGSTRVAHLEDNQKAAHGPMPDAKQRVAMEKYWDSFATATEGT
jgi:aryl-alcohol dehydrogenase-like predicted oxidoreductase